MKRLPLPMEVIANLEEAEQLAAEYQRAWREFADTYLEGVRDRETMTARPLPRSLREMEITDASTVALSPCEPLYRKEF